MPLTIDQDGNDINGIDLVNAEAEFARLIEISLGLDPVESFDVDVVRAIVLYNPLDYTDRTVCDLVWVEGKTLNEYLDGLPEADWSVSIGSKSVSKEEWGSITLAPLDTLIVGVTPNSKILPIIMIVAMVALAVAAPYLIPVIGTVGVALVGGAIAIGGYLIQSMLADKPKDPGTEGNKQSQSYGLGWTQKHIV